MIRRPPRSTLDRSSAASDVYKRQASHSCEEMPASLARSRGSCVSSGMLRVWPLVLALAAACKGDTAAGDPDQPAGKVIELAGKVDAAREGAAVRPLAVGAPVFADDTVT